MARRATFLQSLKSAPDADSPLFLLAGTEEFLRSTWSVDSLDPATAQAMAKAFAAMDYDAIFLGPNEERLANLHFADFPGNFIPLPGVVRTRRLERQGVTLGLVLFPTDVGGDGTDPGEEDFQAVIHAARSLRDNVDVVVGISAWGAEAEQRFLRAAPPVLDMLLGSGPGSVRGRLMGAGKTLWIRSHSEGRSVMVVRMYKLPAPGRAWTPGQDLQFEAARLGDDIADAPDIKKLFQPKE